LKKHNRTVEWDKENNFSGELSFAARILIGGENLEYKINNCPPMWNRTIWKKMCEKSYKERLITAGALIAAEIDRIS